MFPCGQNYANLCLNPASWKTPTLLQNINSKNFHVVSDHNIQNIANKPYLQDEQKNYIIEILNTTSLFLNKWHLKVNIKKVQL